MGKRIVDDASLKFVADVMRELSEVDTELQFPNGFETACGDIWIVGYDYGFEDGFYEGYLDGLGEGAAICATKHFIHSFVGDGAGKASFHVPFEPDAIQIIGLDPTYNKTPYALGMFYYDIRAFGTAGGLVQYGSSSGASTSAVYTTKSIASRYSRTDDGFITIGNFSPSSPVVFSAGYIYTVIATKYTEQTDKERITAFVNRLTGSGTVTLNQEKVAAAFTDDEWATLIARKPGWTFTWI